METDRVFVKTPAGTVLLEENGLTWGFSHENPMENDKVILGKSNNLTCQQVIVIDSIHAGKQQKTNATFYLSLLLPLFSFLGVDHLYWKTTDANSIRSFADKVQSNSLVIFLSGDTSVSEFVNQLQIREEVIDDITVLPFPLGSGNAIANSIGLVTPLKSIEAFISGTKSHLPLYKASFKNAQLLDGTTIDSVYFLIVFSWGLHATLIYRSDRPEMRLKYGNERFAMAAKEISQLDPHFITQSGDDLSYLLLTSLPKLEATFTISPNSNPFIDELHLIEIPHVAPARLMEVVMKGYDNGNHINENEVSYNAIKEYPWELQINSQMDPNFCYICVDGSIFRMDPKDNAISIDIVNQHKFFYLTNN